MAVEAISEAWQLGWRIAAQCALGKQRWHEIRPCMHHTRRRHQPAEAIRHAQRSRQATPEEANDFANRIIDGVVSNMPAPGRTALRGIRMIPEYPPENVAPRMAAAFRAIRPQQSQDWNLARDVWEAVYRHGQALPDDVVA